MCVNSWSQYIKKISSLNLPNEMFMQRTCQAETVKISTGMRNALRTWHEEMRTVWFALKSSSSAMLWVKLIGLSSGRFLNQELNAKKSPPTSKEHLY